jgi:hypothetical protein
MICSDAHVGSEIPVRPDRHWDCKRTLEVPHVLQKQNCGEQLALPAVGFAADTAVAAAVDIKAVEGEGAGPRCAIVDFETDDMGHSQAA